MYALSSIFASEKTQLKALEEVSYILVELLKLTYGKSTLNNHIIGEYFYRRVK